MTDTMNKNMEPRDVCSVSSLKKLNRCRSFHFRYLELCRSKNLTPLPEIRTKTNATSMLDFYGDKLSVTDWLLIVESLYYDQVLQTLAIRLRKSNGSVLDHLDNEKKARLFRQKSVLFTKFIFSGVVEAISNCIEFNKNLRILNLEGLPLSDKYVECVAKALSSNESIKEISFRRSCIYDKGCEAICNTIKYLENVEKLILDECQLTTKGAEHVADMIKIQKISRYTEGWQKSLRYRDVDPDSIAGLRCISLSGNEQIGDDGVKVIVEILKEDVWIKVLDMENCGLTDKAANLILDCLEMNNYIVEFNVRTNPGISKFLLRSIREQLGKDDEEQKAIDMQQLSGDGCLHGAFVTVDGVLRKTKVTVGQLKEQMKTLEEQLGFERMLRKKAEQLNERLNQQIIAYENQMQQESSANIPEGYVLVKNESLQSIIRERNDFHKIATTAHTKTNNTGGLTGGPQGTHIIVNQLSKAQKLQNYDQQSLCSGGTPPCVTPRNTPIDSPTTDDANEGRAVAKDLMGMTSRNVLKVRKVKSEMKYIEPLKGSTKKESKSDHEFANETDFDLSAVIFETNIGDTAANDNLINNMDVAQLTARIEKKSINNANINNMNSLANHIYKNIKNNNKKFEIDDLSISTRSKVSDGGTSSDSDTLRNTGDYQPLKVFIRHPKSQHKQSHEIGQGEGMQCGGGGLQSPRSLFLGLMDN